MITLKMLENSSLELPSYKTLGSAGADVQSREDVVLRPGQTRLVRTGIFISSWETDSEGRLPLIDLRLRSSLAFKHGISIPNGVGTIDPDYPDEICMLLHNGDEDEFMINAGMRIGQLVLQYVSRIDNLAIESVARTGGFGSTGV